MDFQVIFRDFKSSNILLDDQWKAKLSDFGFARFGPLEGESHVSTAVNGPPSFGALLCTRIYIYVFCLLQWLCLKPSTKKG